ncbi:MAG TPA: glycosyltransferase, partial [Blastocatellia bacterium]|nr:glycosyltransferase [Blastocatellia bacterium]
MREDSCPINSRSWWEEYFAKEWDAHGGSDQTRHFMERLIAELPAPEKDYLRSQPVRVLDWGCAFGEGVEVLAEAFPGCRVTGLDFASRAIEQARLRYPNREFILTETDDIPGQFDVIVTSNCLEHFEIPIELVNAHLRSCNKFYVALVPYDEFPLSDYHRSHLTEESFPERLGGFIRLCANRVEIDPLYWNGQQLLVVYGSQSYLRERGSATDKTAEQEKWDEYYRSLPLYDADETTRSFNAELVQHISDLLPNGGTVLEAGCGGGWQSLALAQTGKFQVTLMDFSQYALGYARRLFEREELSAEFIYGDVFTQGDPEFDLVFNAGVLEHYSLQEQANFLRGMASRSRSYVMALVPNRLCYWYWLWRIHKAGAGEWPFGKEVPLASFSSAFEAAGLQFLGQSFMGKTWAEFFITDLPGLDQTLSQEIVRIHRSPLIPLEQKTYLLAGLGCVSKEPAAVPRVWTELAQREDMKVAESNAALADALALSIGADHGLKHLRDQLTDKNQALDLLSSQAAERDQAHQAQLAQLAAKGQEMSGEIADRERSMSVLSETIAEKETTVRTLITKVEQNLDIIQSLSAEMGAREQRIQTLSSEPEEKDRALSRVAEYEQTIKSLSSQSEHKDQAVRTMETLLAKDREAVRALSSEIAEKQRSVQDLSVRLAEKEAQLERLTNSLGWRLLSLYGPIKYRYLLPVYRMLGLMRSERKEPNGAETNQSATGSFTIENQQSSTVSIQHESRERVETAERQALHESAGACLESNAYDVVCFPIIDWGFRIQRPQQLMLQFAAAGHRVFYLAQQFRSNGDAYIIHEKHPNVYEVSLRGPQRNIYTDVLDDEARDELLSALDELRRELSLGASVAIAQLPFWWPLVNRARDEFAWPIIYDCMDHHAGFSTNQPEMVIEEASLLSSADLVVVSSSVLEIDARKHNPNVLLLRNACDYEHFTNATARAPASRPVIGYYGAIADWFDSGLVADLAEKRTDWDFVLVGSTFTADVSRLSKLPNVFLPGEKPYSEIPDWLESFDVAIIPFKRIPLTEATNPVKAYEILASGKPLVSVPIPEMVPLQPLVRLASTAEQFEKEISAALAEHDPTAIEARREFAAENTWEKRFETLAPAVRAAFAKASIIIVTFNSFELNRLCLESLYERTEWPNYEVIVVDNASSDLTREYLKDAEKRFQNLRVFLNPSNLGFAPANNIGLEHATGDYLVLLNNDTVVTRGWLSALVRHLHRDQAIGMIGPVTNAISNEAKVEVGYQHVDEMPA